MTLAIGTARSYNFACGTLMDYIYIIESPQVNTCLHHYSFIPARFLNQDAADGDDVPQDLARGMAIYSATRLEEHDGQHTVWEF